MKNRMKDKISEYLSKPIVYAILLNAVFLILSIACFHPHFEEIDDTIMSFILEGVYGRTGDVHLVYINSCMGILLKGLYTFVPLVKWYTLFQYFFLFISFTIITWILSKRMYHGKWMAALFLLLFFYEGYVSVQYTKTAAIVAVAGYLLIFNGLRQDKKVQLSAGVVLGLFGALYRFEMFLLVTAFMFGVGLWELYCEDKKKSFMRRGVLTFASLFLLVGFFECLDMEEYQRDTDWKEYMEFNDARTELLDYRYDILDYSKYGEQLLNENISQNDALLYLTWQFGDDRVFQNQIIEDILALGEERKIDVKMCRALAENLYGEFFVASATMLGGVFLLLWIILSDRKCKLLWIYSTVMLFASLCYFQYSGRWSHRIVFAAWFAYLVIMMLYSDVENKKTMHGMAAILIFLNIGLLFASVTEYRDYMRNEPKAEALLEYTQSQKDSLYLIDTFTDQNSHKYDIFKTFESGCFSNRAYFGGWLTNSPIYLQVTEAFGYQNAYEALQKNTEGNVYLIDNCYPEEKLLFIEEHYGEKLSLEPFENVGGYQIYRVTKEQLE